MVLVDAAVRENDDVLAAGVGVVDRDIELLQGALKGRVLVVEDRHGLRVEAGLVEVPDLDEVDAGQDRILHLKHAAVLSLRLQQVAVRADVDRRVRDDLLPERVDRRVGHLREHLLEVLEQQLVLHGQHRERRVVAHGGRRLHAVLRHRQDHVLDILVVVAERLVQAVAHLLRVRGDLPVRDRELAQVQQMLVEPLAVRLHARVVVLALVVREDPARLRVDEQHPAGLQPRLLHDVLRRDVEDAHLRGEDQPVVIRDVVSGRAQSVAVERRTDDITVGEKNRRRTVPGLHHRRVIVIEILFLLVHEAVVLPGLRNDHHHREGQVHAVHVEEFQSVVELRGIGARGADYGQHLVRVLLRQEHRHRLLAGQHAVDVAADRVDLAVMRDESVRVGALPARRRIGGKA